MFKDREIYFPKYPLHPGGGGRLNMEKPKKEKKRGEKGGQKREEKGETERENGEN